MTRKSARDDAAPASTPARADDQGSWAEVVASGEPLEDRAFQIGEAWVREYVRDLHANARSPVGAWPGTMTEARGRIVRQLAMALGSERLHALARVTNNAAKRGWLKVCEPDLEA